MKRRQMMAVLLAVALGMTGCSTAATTDTGTATTYFQQLVYFIMFTSRCQQLFYFSLLSFFRGNSDIISCLSLFVNNFFSAIYSVGAQYHLALSNQNCSARVSFVIIPPSSNFVNQKLQIKLYSDNLCCILKLLYHAFYFSHNTRNSYHIAYA